MRFRIIQDQPTLQRLDAAPHTGVYIYSSRYSLIAGERFVDKLQDGFNTAEIVANTLFGRNGGRKVKGVSKGGNRLQQSYLAGVLRSGERRDVVQA